MEKILKTKAGEKIILLGNEAIVRGALEAGVQFVSTYPGTPASEIGNTFFSLAGKDNFYFEFSTNEKVALEAGAGAAFSGLKTLVAMKHFGLNVALDALLPLCYTALRGSMVIVVADDPNGWSSAQAEENTRAFAQLAHIPILEPSDPEECKDFIKFAFELSQKFEMPVIIRITTRVSHQRAVVKTGIIKRPRTTKGKFIKDQKRFVTMPPRVLEMKRELLEKMKKIKGISEKSNINKIQDTRYPARYGVGKIQDTKLGIITSGVSYLYVMEALKKLNLDLPVLKLGFFYPLPKERIGRFIKNLKKVLVVEELEPYLEKEIERFAKDVNPKLKIYGKSHLPEVGELKPEHVISAIASLCGKKVSFPPKRKVPAVARKPKFCPSCPYWSVFGAVKNAAPKNTIYGGGIGCYMMSYFPPFEMQDYLLCMGASLGVAHGIRKATNQKVITFVGDSSFYYAAIPAFINTVFNQSNPLVIIMDNSITAMTGHQPHPGVGISGMGKPVPKIKIEDIVRACQVKHLKIIDPVKNQKELEKTIKEFLNKKEVSVIIARHPCLFVRK